MRLHRFLSLTDLMVALLVLIVCFLPKRSLQASDAYKLDPDPRADLSASEAAALAHPEDGAVTAEYARELMDSSTLDWAVEAARDGIASANAATKWQPMLALSDVYGKRSDAQASYDAAKDALAACTAPGTTCPDWQALKLELYLQYLEGGMSKGIDPRKDPSGFRHAAEGGMDVIGGHGASDGK